MDSPEKKYIFSKEMFLEDMKPDHDVPWIDKADGYEVSDLINGWGVAVDNTGYRYAVSIDWCKEIEEVHKGV